MKVRFVDSFVMFEYMIVYYCITM